MTRWIGIGWLIGLAAMLVGCAVGGQDGIDDGFVVVADVHHHREADHLG